MATTIKTTNKDGNTEKTRLKGRKGSVGKPVGEVQVKTNSVVAV
jgi:hypothetical protein